MKSAVTAKREQFVRLKRSPYLTSPRKQLMNQQLERLDRHTAALTIHTKANLRAAKDTFAQLERRLLLKNPIEYVKHFAQEIIMIQLNLQQYMRERMQQHHHRLQLQLQRLDALSPLKVMQRGYSLAYDQQQRLITTVHQVQPGESLRVRLVDGQLDCRVEAKRGE
jgi:exodeoxyribonuclease VII large subunit